jgi:succinoglycan biosynthesis protein ExoA
MDLCLVGDRLPYLQDDGRRAFPRRLSGMDNTSARPVFTILVACLNEEKRIGAAISSLLDDHFKSNGEMIVLDGGSDDRTREIVAGFVDQGWPIRLIVNPGRIQSEGLNLGLREAKGAFIIRADAHCLYPPRYAERCLEMLARPEIASAGGVMFPVGERPVQRAIALAMRHPIGVGNAKYHLGNHQGFYDGVYLGAFKREVFDRLGGYDPRLRYNEDADLNLRILGSGGKIWLDGTLQVTYFPRDSFAKLFTQYFNYGRGRCRTTLKHRRFTSLRQILPPLLVVSLASALALSFFNPVFLLWIVLYASCVLGISIFSRFDSNPAPSLRILIFLALIVMHTAWGLGFLAELGTRILRRSSA